MEITCKTGTSCFATYKNEILNWTKWYNIYDRIFVFAKNMGKSLSSKYGQKHPDSAKKSRTDVIKLLQKDQFKKKQKQLVIWLVTKLLIK